MRKGERYPKLIHKSSSRNGKVSTVSLRINHGCVISLLKHSNTGKSLLTIASTRKGGTCTLAVLSGTAVRQDRINANDAGELGTSNTSEDEMKIFRDNKIQNALYRLFPLKSLQSILQRNCNAHHNSLLSCKY